MINQKFVRDSLLSSITNNKSEKEKSLWLLYIHETIDLSIILREFIYHSLRQQIQ